LFAEHGQVMKATIRTQKTSGHSKGFGFVEMPRPEGEYAIDAMNGSTLDGRTLRVRIAW
jgi:RNA recognition motif-containing protein